MEHPKRDLLTIGELASRTGVPTATLRSWETRYGFPRPERLAGGHRRYAESDVDAVAQVLRRRQDGVALKAAIRGVSPDPYPSRSVFAELRKRHPELAPQVLTKASLVALSHAIEDECCARAAQPVLFGAFQREAHLRPSRERWVELARTARSAVAFAEPAGDRGAHAEGRLVEVALPADAPLAREWVVVCDAVDLPACLAAVQLPGQGTVPERSRRFEMLWSVDPHVVRDASRVAQALAEEYAPDRAPATEDAPDDDPPPASRDLARGADLFNRMIGYLESGR